MNRPMPARSIGPYQPVGSDAVTAFKISPYSASTRLGSWTDSTDQFDAHLNLHKVRTSTARLDGVDNKLLQLAEAALERQQVINSPAMIKAVIDSLSEDLAKFTD